MTGLMMIEIEKISQKENPNWILVYGDTNSTIAGALVASKLHIKLAHVEAGLRSFNNKMPEEINRIVTDRLSNLLFAPTENAVNNLKDEGFNKMRDKNIIKTGDIMYDAALFYVNFAKPPKVDIPEDYVLSTIHRAENTNDINTLLVILESLNEIGSIKKVVFPVHPRTKTVIGEYLPSYKSEFSNIDFIDPVGYLEMIYLIRNSQYIITDSGGLQKEAYFFNKYCLTLRDQTEWVELIENRYNILSSINKQEILDKYNELNTLKTSFNTYLYGSGNSGEIILTELLKN
jgi:UDP-GlcNAc3NAcA epimerase